MKKTANLNDGCNPELVVGAEFDGILEIPIIYSEQDLAVPENITPFTFREKAVGTEEAIGFFEKDIQFANVLQNPDEYINDFKRFHALISVDCSLYRDAPLAAQVTNLYRNRALGSFYQRNGSHVIPLIRWGNEYTYTTKYFPEKIAFLGVEKNSTVCIGTYGCIKTREDKYYFQAGLDSMLEELTPKTVLVYGAMSNSVFGNYSKYTKFITCPDWITRMHGR